jgi:hypothetical protein
MQGGKSKNAPVNHPDFLFDGVRFRGDLFESLEAVENLPFLNRRKLYQKSRPPGSPFPGGLKVVFA